MDFTAIDFETANYKPFSICQIGLVRIEKGEIVKEMELLVRPPDNYYLARFTNEIHGISPKDTVSSATFAEIWPSMLPFIENQVVVAHNARFDISCLKHVLAFYELEVPLFETKCTYRIYGKGLAKSCAEQNIVLDNHHNALADARACAQLFLKTF